MANNIDVNIVRKSIREKHADFMKKWEHMMDKAEADSRLKLTKMDSRLRLVFQCLCDEHIIDGYEEFKVHPEKSQKDFSYVAYYLVKDDHNVEVVATTDGIILISGRAASELGLVSRFENEQIRYDEDIFDWNAFAGTLVDFIHASIYRRRALTMCKLFGGI